MVRIKNNRKLQVKKEKPRKKKPAKKKKSLILTEEDKKRKKPGWNLGPLKMRRSNDQRQIFIFAAMIREPSSNRLESVLLFQEKSKLYYYDMALTTSVRKITLKKEEVMFYTTDLDSWIIFEFKKLAELKGPTRKF